MNVPLAITTSSPIEVLKPYIYGMNDTELGCHFLFLFKFEIACELSDLLYELHNQERINE